MFDLLKFNNVNLDPLTETYNLSFYFTCARAVPRARRATLWRASPSCGAPARADLAKWPQYCFHVDSPHGRSMGYILGKAEGEGELWHGHVRAHQPPSLPLRAATACVLRR